MARRLVPTHGDAASHNVLDGVDGLRSLDWVRAALSSPARDLA
jgi:thiamine kinase-like enzyme